MERTAWSVDRLAKIVAKVLVGFSVLIAIEPLVEVLIPLWQATDTHNPSTTKELVQTLYVAVVKLINPLLLLAFALLVWLVADLRRAVTTNGSLAPPSQ